MEVQERKSWKARERQGREIRRMTPIALIRTADVWHVPVTITGQRLVDDWPDQGYLPDNVDGRLSEAVFRYSKLHDALRTATADAVARGAPGVPSFWIPGGEVD